MKGRGAVAPRQSKLVRRTAVLVLAAGLATSAVTGAPATIAAHQGDTEPLTEGFGLWPYNGGISTLALPNDLGEQAWQIANTSGVSQQAAYVQLGGSGPYLGGSGLTQGEIDDIKAHGFTLSLRARVVSGPIYDESGSQQVSAAIAVAGFSGFRFEIALGTDGLGNTIVVLPESIAFTGSTFRHAPFGTTFLVPGNDYHLYQLSCPPGSSDATLRIDGTVTATGYPGSAVSGGVVANNVGLAFAALNLATANFALARLESGSIVPATEAARLGSPPTPDAFLPGVTTGPVVGRVWDPVIDHTHFATGALLDFVGVSLQGPTNVSTGLGTLLILPPFANPVVLNLSPGTPFAIPIPNDCSFVGASVWTQGGSVSPGPVIELANALDLVLGNV